MMTGNVRNLHALMPITFVLPDRPALAIEFVVDTGFTGFLTLPTAAVALLRLPLLHRIPATLADDSVTEVAVHEAVILWEGEERRVRVLATGSRPLFGTEMLAGCEFVGQFVQGGLVTIESLLAV